MVFEDSARKGEKQPNVEPVPKRSSLGDAFRTWLKIGVLGFGGPAGQTALMHRIVVDEKRWIDEPRFLHALNYCMLLPGPEAQQLAVYIGWLLHRFAGGLIAGVLFVLPGAIVMMALSLVYVLYRHTLAIEGIFFGIKAAVLAVVVDAVLRIGRRALRDWGTVAIAAGAFMAIFFLNAPFPLIVSAAGLLGFAQTSRSSRIKDPVLRPEHSSPGQAGNPEPAGSLGATIRSSPSQARLIITALVCLVLWFAPTLGCGVVLGWSSTFVEIGMFFSKMAVVTFGGAYAVLSYVAQQAVDTYRWLAPGEMVDGLGLAETTPGPLIMVVQFVGFLVH